MHLILATAALALSSVTPPSGEPAGPEEIAARYFAPPPSLVTQTVFDDSDVAGAGALTLASTLGEVEEALALCKRMRYQMEALIGDTYGSYTVHPGWLKAYQECILTRDAEVKRLGAAIDARERALLDGADAESAQRAADVMARLAIYHLQVKTSVREEVRAQKDFVRYYNTGNRSETAGKAVDVTE